MAHGYRATRNGVVPNACPEWPLDWHELYVLAVGFASDEKCHLHRDIDPDWQWNLSATYQALTLRAVMGGNWQRGGGQGEQPATIWPRELRLGSDEQATGDGVDRGAVAVESEADLDAQRDSMEARRAALRERRARESAKVS